MNPWLATLLAEIASFHPDRCSRNSPKEWLGLDDLVQELAVLEAQSPEAVPVLLGVFERFPRRDGYEVFWGLLHYLESVPGYEAELVNSIRRVPNHMSLVMIQRLINSCIKRVRKHDLAALVSQYEPLAPEVDWHVDAE